MAIGTGSLSTRLTSGISATNCRCSRENVSPLSFKSFAISSQKSSHHDSFRLNGVQVPMDDAEVSNLFTVVQKVYL